jgi:putative PEP-CTERM system TPR-repeat lipoprotein
MKRQSAGMVALSLAFALGISGCGLADDFRMNRHLKKGDQYYADGQWKEATIEYRNVLKYDPENLEILKKLGIAYWESGQIGEAFPPLRRYHDQNPDDLDICLKLGTVYLMGRAPERAREQAEAILAKEPGNIDALALLAEAAQTPEEIQDAIERVEADRDTLGAPDRVSRILGVLYARSQDIPRAEQEFEAAVESAPDSADAHLALARLHLGKGEMEEAEAEFKAAAELSSAESWARLQLADFYLLTLRRDDARATLEAIVAEAPDAFPAWLRLSELAFVQGHMEEAQEALDHVLQPSPEDALGLVLQTRLQLARRETDAALKTATRATKLYPGSYLAHHSLALAQAQAGNTALALTSAKDSVARNPLFADGVLLTASLEMQSGDIVGAIAGLRAYLEQQPRDPRAWELLGEAHLRDNDSEKARAAFAQVASLAPASPKGPYLTGLALLAEGKSAQARQQFERALAMTPGYTDPLARLAAMSLGENKPEQAIQRVERQALLEPESGEIQLLLGQVHHTIGNNGPAEEAYKKAIQLNPNLTLAYMSLGQLYGETQQHERAIRELDKALETDPDQPGARMLWSIAQHLSGHETQAREGYEQLLEKNPRFAPAANNLAFMLAEKDEDLPRAFLLAQAARDAAPDDPQVADTLGWVLFKQRAYPRAEAVLKEAAEKMPDNAEVFYHLGMAQQEMQKTDEARASFNRSLEIDSAGAYGDKARAALAALGE